MVVASVPGDDLSRLLVALLVALFVALRVGMFVVLFVVLCVVSLMLCFFSTGDDMSGPPAARDSVS